MRMQSPASTGILPASYSRRRRNRNESPMQTHNSTYQEVMDVEIPPGSSSYNHVFSPGRSPMHKHILYNSGSDSENDENDEHRINHMQRPCPYEEGYEDVLPKPPPLSDFLVNDRNYQSYLMGGRRGHAYKGLRGRGVLEINGKSWYSEPEFLAKLCAGCSFVGMVFLIYIALILELQPLYIKGVSVKPYTSADGSYRFKKETSNALKAAAAYFLTMVLSIIYLQVKDLNLEVNPHIGRICHLRRVIVSAYFRYRRRHYDSIPDNFTHSYQDKSFGSTLPLHNSHKDDRMLVSRRRTKKNNTARLIGEDEDNAMRGVWDVFKGFGWGGGSSAKGRKKNT